MQPSPLHLRWLRRATGIPARRSPVDISPRDQDEGTFRSSGVRDGEVRIVTAPVTDCEDVDVQCAGTPADVADPSRLGLQPVGQGEQPHGQGPRSIPFGVVQEWIDVMHRSTEFSVGDDDGIEEVRLIDAAHGSVS